MNETQKHTPGPWAWDGGCLMSQQSYSAVVLWYTSDDDGVHCRPADRPLIAAAPDLLAALMETVDDLDRAYDDGGGARPTAISATIARARAAIARAEGGQS